MSKNADARILETWKSIIGIKTEKTENKKRRGKIFNCRLGKSFGDVYFTKRESQCMLLVLKGNTMREAAVTLGISDRTIEDYLYNMKKKLNCRTKSQLIETVLRSDFLQNKCIIKLLKRNR